MVAPASFIPIPPFKVLAERIPKPRGSAWIVHAVIWTLPRAIAAAQALVLDAQRHVKVTDLEDRVVWRPPAPTGAGKCSMCRRRPARVTDPLCAICWTASRAKGVRQAATAAAIPVNQACVTCKVKYRQDGNQCRACSGQIWAAGERDRVHVEQHGKKYPRGAICPIRLVGPRPVKIRDEHGQEIDAVVVWDGTHG
jgi:hypothetical protein